ncbi:MAG: D-sedoheptulose 7-phosphate isomerase [Candidatus Lernaella stagnicola]|nr:D-sedoheptulose 7-phosphate isomerase [Candidatus Lernaella stagnicola]
MPFDVPQYAKDGADLRVRFLTEHEADIRRVAAVILDTVERGGKLLAFGNGGSAADAQHLAGEMVGRFKRERKPLAAVALSTDTSVLTCIGNDFGYEEIFSRQVQALGRPGDVAWAISTSGHSPNVLRAIDTAKSGGLFVVGLTGHDGGAMAEVCDLALVVPSDHTALIQEIHTTILHVVCELIDEQFGA